MSLGLALVRGPSSPTDAGSDRRGSAVLDGQ